MKSIYLLKQKKILLVMIFLFILTSCGSDNFNENPSIVFTPIATMRTVLPVIITPPVFEESQEPTIIPTSSFSNGAVTIISQQELTNDIFQEIVRFLVTKWLQGFQINPNDNDAIKDFKIDKIIIRNHPIDFHSEIIATVLFSVQVVNPRSNNWASVSIQDIKENDTWWQVALTFDIFPVDNYYELKVLFGYGT